MQRYKSKGEKIMDSVDKNEEKWVGIEEAANHLGVNKDTIRNWIKKENGYNEGEYSIEAEAEDCVYTADVIKYEGYTIINLTEDLGDDYSILLIF